MEHRRGNCGVIAAPPLFQFLDGNQEPAEQAITVRSYLVNQTAENIPVPFAAINPGVNNLSSRVHRNPQLPGFGERAAGQALGLKDRSQSARPPNSGSVITISNPRAKVRCIETSIRI